MDFPLAFNPSYTFISDILRQDSVKLGNTADTDGPDDKHDLAREAIKSHVT